MNEISDESPTPGGPDRACEPTRRWRLDISYDGTAFHGWAVQHSLRTVQGTLEDWITKVIRSPVPVQLTVAGRTDAGVHARGQVAHMDLPQHYDASHLVCRLRKVLPKDIAVHDVRAAHDGFDARFSALWRHYVYRIWDADALPDPLMRCYVTQMRERLDIKAMNQVAQLLTGLRDFAPFCRRSEFGTSIRHLTDLHIVRTDDPTRMIECHVRADAFCHSMVRSLIGALWAVGSGRRTESWLATVAAQPYRHSDVYVMPAQGLCLEAVGYPSDDQLGARAARTRTLRTPQEVDR